MLVVLDDGRTVLIDQAKNQQLLPPKKFEWNITPAPEGEYYLECMSGGFEKRLVSKALSLSSKTTEVGATIPPEPTVPVPMPKVSVAKTALPKPPSLAATPKMAPAPPVAKSSSPAPAAATESATSVPGAAPPVAASAPIPTGIVAAESEETTEVPDDEMHVEDEPAETGATDEAPVASDIE